MKNKKSKTNGYYKKKNHRNRGASVIEALISMAILSYVVVSILAGISNQQMLTKNTTDKQMAVLLAEMRMEELMKFPVDQLAEEELVDYIINKAYGFEVYTEAQGDPRQEKQFRRTTKIIKNLLQKVATIKVRVDYGAVYTDISGSRLRYPGKVILTSRRTTK